MAFMRVPVFRSEKTVAVENGATKGAVIGTNLLNPDGTLFDPEALIEQAQQNPPAPQDLTTDDVTEGQYNLYYTDDRVRTVLGRTILTFAYGDASPHTIYIAPDNRMAVMVRIVIDTPFNGAGAALQIGTAALPGLLMAADANDPTTAAAYESAPDVDLNSGDAIQLTITPGAGASQGGGRIILDAYER